MYQARIWARVAPVLLSATMVALAACADKNLPAEKGTPAGVAAVPRDSLSGGTTAMTSTGVVAVHAPVQDTARRDSTRKDTAHATAGVPKRSHKDSVALSSMTTKRDSVLDAKWPVKMPEPLPGAVLPANRIVAFYGNPLEKKMGVLGEYPKDTMLAMLDREVTKWAKADPEHPVIPALHMVVTTAQGAPGKNGLYRLRMRDSLVDAIYGWAKAKHALFFVDVQLGKDNVMNEIPRLGRWLENPDVHLAVDPEFAMATSGKVPGTKIGTLDAKDINWCVRFLDSIATAKNLPPKILIVHRFTRPMVTNYRDIKFTPHVQVVMDMDGWGPPWLKFDSYHDYVKAEPVQFTGFKLFYHNDTKKGDLLLTPLEVLRLNPKPLYIQYQ